MKRGNINHVRNSHYSCQNIWYYLCDKYGIYLEDEANIEAMNIITVKNLCLMFLNSKQLMWHV